MLRCSQAVVDEKTNNKSRQECFLIHPYTGGNFHIVMNGVACYQNTSLNENLIKATDHMGNLFSVLLQFCQFKVEFMGDVKSMYLQCPD